MQKTNLDYWHKKIKMKIERDKKIINALEAQGWNVIEVWQCENKTLPNRKERFLNLIHQIIK